MKFPLNCHGEPLRHILTMCDPSRSHITRWSVFRLPLLAADGNTTIAVIGNPSGVKAGFSDRQILKRRAMNISLGRYISSSVSDLRSSAFAFCGNSLASHSSGSVENRFRAATRIGMDNSTFAPAIAWFKTLRCAPILFARSRRRTNAAASSLSG